MSRRLPAILTSLALLGAALPAAAQAKHAPALPVISSISPLSIGIGETLTINGKHFVKGTGKNTVVFKRDKGRAIFVKAGKATTTQLTVVVPEKLRTFLPVTKGSVGNAHFRVRVLSKRLSKAFTAFKASPLVGPYAGGAASPPPPPPPPDCDGDGQPDDADSDNDLIPDAVEVQIGTNRCKADTDGDGVSDAFEYESALDLNVRALPYPGKKPYSNPLDPTDANIDFDGDGLTQTDEYRLFSAFGTKTWPLELNYSDGQQATGAPVAAPGDPTNPQLRFLDTNRNGTVDNAELTPLDFNRNGVVSPYEYAYNDFNANGLLTDDERDADGDGLANFDETHAAMTADWWTKAYGTETHYPIVYLNPDEADADTDGDGLVDGLDDQDYDGSTNLFELSRLVDLGGNAANNSTDPGARVNPFNPCLPSTDSRDCMMHPPFTGAPAPFDGSDPLNYEVHR